MSVFEKFKSKYAVSAPVFRAGDTLKVVSRILEGNKSRLQSFIGVCIHTRRKNSFDSSFTVRKFASNKEGIEKTYLYSSGVDIEVIQRGRVKRSRLYYLRKLQGKKAKIRKKL